MIATYIKISWRSLVKRRLFTLVNLLGLTLGLSAFLVLFAYVASEWTYNDFHVRKDQIYRLGVIGNSGEANIYLPPGYAATLEDKFSEVEKAHRWAEYLANGLVVIPESGEAFKEQEIQFVEEDFFETFSFPIQFGKANLNAPGTAVITEEISRKYFGTPDAVGRSFSLSNQFGKMDYTVIGVMDNIPDRSDLKGNIFLSVSTLENPANRNGNDWADPNGLESSFVNIFLQIKPGADISGLEKQINALIKNTPGYWEVEVFLQPLTAIHLAGSLSDPYPTFGSRASVLVFLAMAFLILGIAYVNYLNLSSASILTRIKEIKMRKVLGAQNWQLAQQFMIETLILLGLALSFSFLILYLVKPWLTDILGKSLWFGVFSTPGFWLILVAVFLGCMLISGFYVVALAGKHAHGNVTAAGKSQLLRKSLVVFQFVISISIICCTLVIRNQLNFMQDRDLGINIQQKLVIEGPEDLGEDGKSKILAFKQALASQSFVQAIGASNAIPGKGFNFKASGIFPMVERPEDKDKTYSILIMDEKFIDTYEIERLAGRNFTREEVEAGWTGSKKLMLNESAAKSFGFDGPDDAVGKYINWGDPYEVVAVVKDYHHMSLREEIPPMILLPAESSGYFSLTVDADQIQSKVEALEEIYKDIFPGNPFNFFFMDESFAEQYQLEVQLSRVFTAFGILAIVISCLGLFALAAYSVQQRTKEIGIRKVLGASSESLIRLVSKDFMILVGLAILFAFPIAWYAMRTWQMDFPYKAGLSVTTFVLAGGLSFLVALLTVGIQAIRAAWANPVDSIRNE
ncbi:ABC transporter permease [Algoriphagus lacus]|uniref:ABC transporter permease n=1 Tax=Algoriphagus lacus TaxID=2056311 RepID=A0A418PN53_9BACT|nr:ABC transporter permease [Algoriphagus lacus]RIW12940.1 ABC transporter permease [Algoriphagus lacus]